MVLTTVDMGKHGVENFVALNMKKILYPVLPYTSAVNKAVDLRPQQGFLL
ncbi:MAG: hypothetical protein GXP19_07320 [Gammaproteobacteria bacterium]|nr:hypothetical protein [Gammaproteobacteria bacterium]